MRSESTARAGWLRAIVAIVLVAGAAGEAAAQCGGTQLCAPGAGDCTISSTCTITLPPGGLSIDLGARRLVINKALTVQGPAGASLYVDVGDLVINGDSGGSIVAPGADSVGGEITIWSATNVTVQGNALIDVSAGISPGSVELQALAGDLNVAGRIKAIGGTREGIGGQILLYASGNATVTASTIDASGGDLGFGGGIDISADTGSLTVTTPLKASGGDGGDIELSAGTSLVISSSADFNVNSNGDAGSAGTVDISAVDDVMSDGDIVGTGSATDFREEGRTGGDGTDVDVSSDFGDVTLNGRFEIGGAPGGFGGAIDVFAGGNVAFTNVVLSQSDGIDGSGGSVSVFAGGDLSLQQKIDVRGRTGFGGTIDAEVDGDVTVSGTLIATGDSFGGDILLAGCAVTVTSPASLSTQGPFPSGTNTLEASSTMIVSGALTAGGANLLRYRAAPAPSIAGANIQPAPTIELVPGLPCCLNCPVTTTTTRPPTSTTTPTTSTTLTTVAPTTSTSSTTSTSTSTSTSTTVSVCGDGIVGGTEQCDDHNTVGGDCCSASCAFEPAGSSCAADANPCTSDVCNATGACTHPAGNAGAPCRAAAGECDQAETCTGTSTACPADAKRTAVCRPAAGPCDRAESCDGVGNACPPDGFAPATTVCRAAAGDCDRAETCTGSAPGCPADAFQPAGTTCRAAVSVCDVAETCSGAGSACPPDGFVPDGTSCGGDDQCSGGGTCQGGVCDGGEPISCGPCETCDPSGGCIAAPRPTCSQPAESGKALLKLRNSLSGPIRDQLLWKWLKGAHTDLADFGDPLTTDGLTLCIFDRSQASPSLLFRAAIPAGGTCDGRPCWVGKGRNFKFSSKAGDPEGVQKLLLKPGSDGKAKVFVNAKGLRLSDRPFELPTPSLPVPLTVQLQSANGKCWEANYERSGLKMNDGQTFYGKAE